MRTGGARAVFVAVALVALGGQAVLSAVGNSATDDEPDHLVSGLAALRTGDFRMSVDHPPLMNVLCGAAAYFGGAPALPLEAESWREARRVEFARAYLWRGPAGPMAPRLILLGRMPVIAVSLGLALLVLVWARRLYGWPAAGLALGLYCFEPNVIAHSSLATNDLGVAAGYALSAYTYWRYLQEPSRWRLGLAGVALGAALLAKFSGVLLLAALPAMAAVHASTSRKVSAPRLIGGLAMVFAVAAAVVWAGYGFGLGAPEGWDRVPVGQYASGVLFQLGHEKTGHPAYLLGQISTKGWWYYFPIALLVKTPLPLLILVGLAIGRGRFARDEAFVAVPAGLFFLAAVVQNLNIGLRYILPVYPLMIVFAARVLARPWPKARRRWGQAAVAALVVWMAAEALIYAPQYLPYFNELAGGPKHGLRVLADSNIDWGQDLKRLATWQREHPEADPLYLSYFGNSDPVRYGVRAEPLPGLSMTYPLEEMSPDWFMRESRPRTGWIAISANCLTFDQAYSWLREHQPVGRAGYSILIYHVPEGRA